MAVPARRTGKARKNKRRSSVWKMDGPSLQKCPQCGDYKESHKLCNNCGYYNGRKVIEVED